jgi:hypothetical protein
MPDAPTVILNSTPATALPCGGGGDVGPGCHDLFTLSGDLLSQGDNVLAVEVHNRSTGPDLVFGSALLLDSPSTSLPQLNLLQSGNDATFYWNDSGFVLQKTEALSEQAQWTDVPGGDTSPVFVQLNSTVFYRLRK